jgi:hypothetical protein
VMFTNGVNLSGPIGWVSLVTDGFGSQAKTQFYWVNAGQLGGTDAFPIDASRVVAQ